ncbi:iron-sulfur protein I [Schizosaccharomyces japonicus yFS275]|uniref:Iron-sulfur protein I n=1 Tax=Schizosaccharomyces japonicus (strain yFS275 / FY16936) TaxID=402676 RepID=B6K5P0_SCHJY|nr:iron-sulfur protein I [Schizosaccharomyces japonicus yFS275]EEB08844.2 iron-sulfur protein I [Schizosaccharomyces japonicus yFS275]
MILQEVGRISRRIVQTIARQDGVTLRPGICARYLHGSSRMGVESQYLLTTRFLYNSLRLRQYASISSSTQDTTKPIPSSRWSKHTLTSRDPRRVQASGPDGRVFELLVDDSAVKQLENICRRRNTDNVGLRLTVEGGGCHGYQVLYSVELRGSNDDDITFQRGKARIYIDTISAPLLQGSTLVYKQELIGSSFQVVDNPNAKDSCGCNVSFALKDTDPLE